MRTEVQDLVATLPHAGLARASRLGLELAPQLEVEAWREVVTQIARLTRTTTGARQTLTAWLGDALAYGEVHYRGRIVTCAHEAGLEAGTLRNAKMVCSRIPLSCRHDTLSWTHHCEVGLAFAEPDAIRHWLTLAEREKLTTAELRRHIRSHLAGSMRASAFEQSSVSRDGFRLMRDLKAAERRLTSYRRAWLHWSPSAAQLALQELRSLTDFVDELRARALQTSARPTDLELN